MYTLVLASQSPRRSELLKEAGFSFTVVSEEVSESFEKNLNFDAVSMEIARRKAEAVWKSPKISKLNNILILSADTIVIFENEVLGKPENIFQAENFLKLLSGSTHSVKTGVCFIDTTKGQVFTYSDTTEVTFRKLSSEEIKNYISTGEPMDKAGAYGIQGRAGAFVEKIVGSYSNVVGLPMELVKNKVNEHGWKIN